MGCIGQREDIINLVAHSDSGAEKRPLVISTLTRKFFIQSSHLRGYHFELVQCHEKVGHGVSKLYEIVGEVDSKLKEDGTLRQNIPMDVSDSSTPQIVGRKNRNQQNRSNVSTKTFKVRPPWKY